ncbi:MAG: DUF1572 family protein, partial [Gemmatimonadaceae bacterium]
QLFATIDPEANSIAILIKHLHGNMRSRWTDFLTSDGEKADRARDDEFVLNPMERNQEAVRQWWERGWQYVFDALAGLKPADLHKDVTIRGQTMTALSAILRQIDHYGQHVGQIILLARHLAGSSWQTPSIPRGKSAEFEAEFRRQLAGKTA